MLLHSCTVAPGFGPKQMRFHWTFIVMACLVMGLALPSGAGQDECVYAGDTVELAGTLTRETFPGPPNYQSIEEGDAPETYWFVTRDEPVCVYGWSPEREKYYRLGELDRFQLVLTRKQYEENSHLVTDRIYVKGQLFTGMTGHHHTEALIDVSDIGASN